MGIGQLSRFGKFAGKNPSKIGIVFYYLKTIIFIIWIMTILVAVYGAYSERGVPGTIDYLGKKVATPTFNINEHSQKIISNGEAYVSTGNFFSDLFGNIKTYWNLIFALINLLIWVMLIKLAVIWLITGDTSRVTANWIATLIIFFLLQMLFIAYFHEAGIEGITIPFEAFKNLFEALMIIFS